MVIHPLETVDLDALGVELETVLLVGEEIGHVLALIALELNHFAHLIVGNDGAIAGELLLDDSKDLLPREFLRNARDGGQTLTSIALLDANVDVILGLRLITGILFTDVCEGVERLEVFD